MDATIQKTLADPVDFKTPGELPWIWTWRVVRETKTDILRLCEELGEHGLKDVRLDRQEPDRAAQMALPAI